MARMAVAQTTHGGAQTLLAARRAEHDALLERAIALLEPDERVAGAWLFGSRGRGDADALSDVDLVVVAHDEHLEALKEERRELVSRLGAPLLIQDLPRNAPPGGAYLLVLYPGQTGPLHADWYWRGLSGATVPHDARLVLERPSVAIARQAAPAAPAKHDRALQTSRDVIFFWAMAPIAAKYIARRKPVKAVEMLVMVASALDRTRRAVGADAEGAAGAAGAAGGRDVRLQGLVTADRGRQVLELRRLCEEMRALSRRIGPLHPAAGSLAPDAPEHVLRLVDQAERLAAEE